MSPKVSILIPLFNAEKWIEATIRTVFKQTYLNWELIVVDDGSTDHSYELVSSLVKNDFRVKVLKKRNMGACAARNFAFSMSTGTYIQYLDSDDLLGPDKIERQLKVLTNGNDKDAIASCEWQKFNKVIGDMPVQESLLNKNYLSPIDWLRDSWLYGGHGAVMMWLTPRSLIEKSGGWDESLKINQDGEFFSRIILLSSKIQFVDSVKVYYRIDNPNSISQSKMNYSKAESLLRSYILYEKHLNLFKSCKDIQTALVANYLKFVANNFKFLELVKVANDRINNLPLANRKMILQRWFHPIAGIIGFDNYLKIKRIKDKLL